MTPLTATGNSQPFPRWFLIGAFSLIGAALAFAAAGRLGIGTVNVPNSPAILHLDVRFDDQPDGATLIRRLPDGLVLDTLGADGGGFLRGVLKSLQRERAMRGLDRDAPFTLIRRADQRHTLIDPLSGQRRELDGFGPAHSLAAARLMESGRRAGANNPTPN